MAFNFRENGINIICCVLLVILIIVLIVCLCTNRDKFSDKTDNDDTKLVMIHLPTCPFSNKMMKLLKENNFKMGKYTVEVIDSSKNPDAMREYKGNGTPHFALKSDPTINSPGFRSIKEHLDTINSKLSNRKGNNGNNGNTQKIKIVGRSGCPFCVQTYDLFNKLNIEFENISNEDSLGISLMKKHGANGVPLIIFADGDHIVGFDEKKIREKINK